MKTSTSVIHFSVLYGSLLSQVEPLHPYHPKENEKNLNPQIVAF